MSKPKRVEFQAGKLVRLRHNISDPSIALFKSSGGRKRLKGELYVLLKLVEKHSPFSVQYVEVLTDDVTPIKLPINYFEDID